MATCIKCDEEKAAGAFRVRVNGKAENTCRVCMAAHARAWRDSNPARVIATRKQTYASNKERLLAAAKEWRSEHPGYKSPKQSVPGYSAAKARRWMSVDRPRKNAKKREWARRQTATNLNFRIAMYARTRLVSALRRRGARASERAGSAVRDLGCSIEQFTSYMASKFSPGMSWDNWGRDGWHIDHITPLASFDLTNREQFTQAVHYTNLQPLWAEDNWAKNARESAQ